jgi:hypothetical protein
MNEFIQYSGDTKRSESPLGSGRYYARFSQAETDVKSPRKGSASLWILEAFDARWFDSNQPPEANNPEVLFAYYERAELFVLEILHLAELSNFYGPLGSIESVVRNDEEVATWFSIQAGPLLASEAESDGVTMTVYTNLYAIGTTVAVREIGQVSSSTQTQLDRAVNTDGFPDATEEEITAALGGFTGQKLDWAVVYDVGQGGSNGFCTARGPVHGYFDLGGGVLRNSFTFPPALHNFCFSSKPPIILSHWDWDHWSSANRNPASFHLSWIAPRQVVGPIHLTLMTNITHYGRLLLLSATFSAAWRGQIYLEKCTGSGRNHSGLSLTFSEKNGGKGKLMLFPGDARYSAIPSFRANKYLSLVTPHHGAEMGGALVPNNPGGTVPRLAHSFGLGNSYSHPRLVTRQRHAAKGWIDPVVTPGVSPFPVRQTADRNPATGLGHVLLAWKTFPACPPSPCAHVCQLQPQQL